MPPYDDFITQAISSIGGGVDPEVLRAMMMAESSFNPNALSPKGAMGLMQVMPDTAAGMGFSPEDLADPYKNTLAGATYAKQMLGQHEDDPIKMLAAYNWGPGNLAKYGMDPSVMPEETLGYIDKIAQRVPSLAEHPTYMALKGQKLPDPRLPIEDQPIHEQPEYGRHDVEEGLRPTTEQAEMWNNVFEISLKKLFPANLAGLGSLAIKAAEALPGGGGMPFVHSPGLEKPFEEKAEKWRDEGEDALSDLYLRGNTSGSWREIVGYTLSKSLGENPDLVIDALAGVSSAKLAQAVLKHIPKNKIGTILGKNRIPFWRKEHLDEATSRVTEGLASTVKTKVTKAEETMTNISEAMTKLPEMEDALSVAANRHFDDLDKIYKDTRIWDTDLFQERLTELSSARQSLMLDKFEELKRLQGIDGGSDEASAVISEQIQRVRGELDALVEASKPPADLPTDGKNPLAHKFVAAAVGEPKNEADALRRIEANEKFFFGEAGVEEMKLGPVRNAVKNMQVMFDWSKSRALSGMRRMGRMNRDLSAADEFEALSRMELDAQGVVLNDIKDYTFYVGEGGEPIPNGMGLQQLVDRYKALDVSEEAFSKAVNGRAVSERILEDGVQKLNVFHKVEDHIRIGREYLKSLKSQKSQLNKLADSGGAEPQMLEESDSLGAMIREVEGEVKELVKQRERYSMRGISLAQTKRAAELKSGLDYVAGEDGIEVANRINADVRAFSARAFLEKMYHMDMIDDKEMARLLADNKFYASLEKKVDSIFGDQADQIAHAGNAKVKSWLHKWEGGATKRGQLPFERLIQKLPRFNKFYLQHEANKTFIDEYALKVEEYGVDKVFEESSIHLRRLRTKPSDDTPFIEIWREGKKEYWGGSNGIIDELNGVDNIISAWLQNIAWKKAPGLNTSLGDLTRAMRTMATATLTFIGRAPFRDLQSQWVNSITRPRPVVDTLQGFAQMIKNRNPSTAAAWDDALQEVLGTVATEFWTKGHGASFMQAMDMPSQSMDLSYLYASPRGKFAKAFKNQPKAQKAFYPFEVLGKNVDVATRMGRLQGMLRRAEKGKGLPFEAALDQALRPSRYPVPEGVKGFNARMKHWMGKEGDTFVGRLRDTQDPTLNFQQFGTLMRGLNSYSMFQNPVAKSTTMIAKRLTNHPISFLTRGAMPMTAYAAYMWYAHLADDPEWNETELSKKMFHIPLPYKNKNGVRYALPVDHQVGFAFFVLPILLFEAAAKRVGKDEVKSAVMQAIGHSIPIPGVSEGIVEAGREMASPDVDLGRVARAAGVGALPSPLQPVGEHMQDWKSFEGRTVRGPQMNPSQFGPMGPEQITEYTPPTSEYLAKLVGGSPILFDHYIDGWFPGIGRNIQDATAGLTSKAVGRETPALNLEDLRPRTGHRKYAAGRVWSNLVKRGFSIPPPYGPRSKSVKDLKKLFYDLKPQEKSIEFLEKELLSDKTGAERKRYALDRVFNIVLNNPHITSEYIGDLENSVNFIDELNDKTKSKTTEFATALDMMEASDLFSDKEKNKFYEDNAELVYGMQKDQTAEAQRLLAIYSDEDFKKRMAAQSARYLADLARKSGMSSEFQRLLEEHR
jgi:hypothetical protein